MSQESKKYKVGDIVKDPAMDLLNHYTAEWVDVGVVRITGVLEEEPCNDIPTITIPVEDYIKLIEQEPRWIPVSKRLPNDNRKQLVYTKYGTYDIATYRKNKKEWMVSNEIDTYICGVIAWMPLPEPYWPQESEDKE